MEALNFVVSLKGDGAITEAQKLSVSFSGLFNSAQQLKTIGIVQLSEGFSNLSDEIKNATQPGAAFEQGLADLEAITGITGNDLSELGKAAREVGQESGLGAGQAVEAFKLLASNIDVSVLGGVKGLKALQKETITLSQAAGVDLPTAANAMSFALNQFSLPATEAARVINALGAGAKFGAAEIPDLAEALKQSGSTAAQAGVQIESAIGAIEILSQRGIKGAEAGTMLRNVLLKLQTEEIPGVDLKAQGLAGALGNMKAMMNDAVVMEKIFGRENINAAQILISSSDAVSQMTERVTGTNVAYEQAEIRTRTYGHTIAQIKSKMDDYKISIFNTTGAFLPFVEIGGQATATFSRMVPAMQFGAASATAVYGSVKTLVTGLKSAKTAQDALSFAFTKSPWGAVITGVVLLGGALAVLASRSREASVEQKIQNDALVKAAEFSSHERVEIDRLFDSLKRTNPATEERKKAIAAMNEKYPEYLKNLNLEKAGAEDIAKAYKQVVAEMDKKARSQAWDSLMSNAYEEVAKTTVEADSERASNKPYEDQIKKLEARYKTASFQEKSRILNDIQANSNMIKEGAQKEESTAKRKRDVIYFKKQADMMSVDSGSSVGASSKTGSSADSSTKSHLKEEKKKAVNSISGDNHAIKNINIHIDSLIKTNNNFIEQGAMNLNAFQDLLKQALMRVVNDVNIA